MIKTFNVGKWSVLSGFLFIALILYFPVLSKGFVSDDFTVLFRLINTKDFTPPGFFRPGADISLYSTYLLSGLNPLAYNISNLFIHVLNSWLLFLVCRKFFSVRSEARSTLPLIASLIFLIYPFHQEPIVWVLGRGILLSSFFALLSLYVLFNKNFTFSIVSAALFYFLSLLCYESAAFIPFIAFLVFKNKGIEKQKTYWLIILFSVAFLSHLVMRSYFSGSVIGAYGKDLNAFEPGQYFYEYVKFWLRLVMVPLSNIYLFVGAAVLLLVALVYAIYKLSTRDLRYKNWTAGLVLILILSFLVPAFFGITIRTSEGDRFLYFPSIFFSVLLALTFSYRKNLFPYLLSLYAVASVILININNQGWIKSSGTVESIIRAVKKNSEYKVILYNLPASKNGKYIFRNGFREALLLNKIDTSGIYVNNMYEAEIREISHRVQPPFVRNEKGRVQLAGSVPFNLVAPFCIINISDDKVHVFQVGYSK